MLKHLTKTKKAFFTRELLNWHSKENKREMPWKNQSDPYKIWLSEVILQQTRVQQGESYYNRFIEAFPTVEHLAAAPETKVFKLWEGLGYYNRCKNMIATARHIVNELEGNFPTTFNELLQLKGVGNYTASAIASFAYNLPHAVLDGNVFRVLSRFFGISLPIDSNAARKIYLSLADELLSEKNPAIYNQAIMDFGATVCKPQQPLCERCPLKTNCFACNAGIVNDLPVKEKILTRRHRCFNYLQIEYNRKVYVRKRIENDIWQNLNEFVLIETTQPVSTLALETSQAFKKIFNSARYTFTCTSKVYTQQLTHQTITGQFIRIKTEEKLDIPGYRLIPINQLNLLPFPKFITTYLKD
jgi:A/G-specific adenine glycosylase